MLSARMLLRAAAVVGAGVALIGAGLRPDGYVVQLVIWTMLNAVLAASMRLVLLLGETNMAAGAFYGLAAYGTAISATIFNFPMVPSIGVGILLAIVVSAIFGAITLRTKGPYFMLIGFALTEIVRLIYTRTNFIGGNSGMVGIYVSPALDPWMPSITIACCILVLLILFWIERSDLGLLFLAIRNNDAIVQSVGIHLLATKILCVCIAAAAAGVAGAFHAYTFHVISPGDFSFLLPVFALAYVKVGGEGHLGGTVIGAALLTFVGQYLQGTGELEQILFGGVIVLTMLVAPGGLWELAGKAYAFMRRRPAEVAGRLSP